MATSTTREKTVDLPPRGPRNADPITDAPGAHPIETGIGTALGGAAAGFIAGVAAGPVGAVTGAIIGGVAGGFAGKGIGELIDPTTDDRWLREEFANRPYVKTGETFDHYKPVYQFGARAEANNVGRPFTEVEPGIQKDYETSETAVVMPWGRAKPAVEDAYNRTCQIRKDRTCNAK